MSDYMTNYIIMKRELWGKLSYFFTQEILINKYNNIKY